MQTIWLHRTHRPECILFFSGWGMDPTPFRFLSPGSCDLCMVMDYRNLQPLSLDPFAGYKRLHLVAWSMGVWVAARLLAGQANSLASATALGGTLLPVDKQRGIPTDNYNEMADHLNGEILATFYRNMFDDADQLARFLATRPERALGELREEMTAFRDAFVQHGPGCDIFSQKIITSRDRIFPGRNQMRAWGRGNGTVRNWPHFPFYLLASWQDLLPGSMWTDHQGEGRTVITVTPNTNAT